MERRIINGLPDARVMGGSYATRWEGWKNPSRRSLPGTSIQVRPRHPLDICDALYDGDVGCYSIMYKSSTSSLWVAYIGYSRVLRKEIPLKLKHFDHYESHTARYRVSVIQIPNSSVAKAYEYDLIRYYTPPWNVRYSKQA